MKALIALIIVFAIPSVVYAQTPSIGQVMRSQDLLNQQDSLRTQVNTPKKMRLRQVILKGFKLKDTTDLDHLLSSYRNKYVTQDDLDAIVDQVHAYYTQAGYDNLVQFDHTFNRGKLTITATLINS